MKLTQHCVDLALLSRPSQSCLKRPADDKAGAPPHQPFNLKESIVYKKVKRGEEVVPETALSVLEDSRRVEAIMSTLFPPDAGLLNINKIMS